jgi:hypothetical protein
MTNTLIIKAIRKINPNAEVTISGGDIDTIVWCNGTQPIPKKQILNILPQIEKEFNAINNRINEYGSIAEQIEYITENGLDAWQSKVNSIKAKYPKE